MLVVLYSQPQIQDFNYFRRLRSQKAPATKWKRKQLLVFFLMSINLRIPSSVPDEMSRKTRPCLRAQKAKT